MTGTRWSSADDALLKRELARGVGWSDRVATGRAVESQAVRHHARRLIERGEISLAEYEKATPRRGGYPLHGKRWTVDDVFQLRQLAAEGRGIAQIAMKLKRSEKSIEGKVAKLHIHIKRQSGAGKPSWTEIEDRILREQWPGRGGDAPERRRALAATLGRSPQAVGLRAHRLGLTEPKGWKPADDLRLRGMVAAGKSDAEIGAAMNRHPMTIAKHRYRIGLVRQGGAEDGHVVMVRGLPDGDRVGGGALASEARGQGTDLRAVGSPDACARDRRDSASGEPRGA